MLLLNELEEAVGNCFCCLLAQSHPAACIAFPQLLLRFTCLLCSSAYGFSLIVCLFVMAIIVFGVLCSSTTSFSVPCMRTSSLMVCLLVLAIIVFGVLCSSTTGCGVLCSCTSSSALYQHLVQCCNFCSLCSSLWWQCEVNKMLDHDAIRRKRTKLGCEICGCLHQLARRVVDIIARLLLSPALDDHLL